MTNTTNSAETNKLAKSINNAKIYIFDQITLSSDENNRKKTINCAQIMKMAISIKTSHVAYSYHPSE